MALFQYISFAGTKTSYGEIPVEVLGGASVFTIEAKIATTSTKTNSTYYGWGTIIGRELSGTWKNDFSLCVNDGKLCFWAQPSSNGSSSTYQTKSEAIVNDGEIHKVAVVSNSDGSIDLYCDNVNVAHTDGVNAKITDAATLLIGYNTNSSSPLAFDLHELRLWNTARSSEQIFSPITGNETSLRAWYVPTDSNILIDRTGNYNATLYGSPTFTELNSLNITLHCDVAVKIKNPLQTWKYLNAGTADLLSIEGTTLENLPITQSRTGTAFYQTARTKCFDLPATPEVWIKFDVYSDGSSRWRAYNDGENEAAGISGMTNGVLYFYSNGSEIYHASNVCNSKQLHSVWLHMLSGSTDGIIEAWVDGTKIYTYTGDVNHGQNFSDIYLQSGGYGTFFSNIIISNVEIGLNETLLLVSADFDTVCNIKKTLQIDFDVSRSVKRTIDVTLPLDVIIKKHRDSIYRADVLVQLTEDFPFSVDIALRDVIPVSTTADVKRSIAAKIDYFTTDSKEIFPTESSLPVTISPDIKPKVAENTIGLQSFEVSLTEQQITDLVKFTCRTPFEILQHVKGQFLDYQYDFRVESIQRQGILYSCTCHTNIDEMFFTPLNYYLPSETVGDWYINVEDTDTWETGYKRNGGTFYIFPEASKHIEKIAEALNLQTVMCFQDFYSTVEFGEQEESGATYNDIIRELFGWSSRVPTDMINAYIRAGVLYVIQRGYEQHVIDISGTKHSPPLFSHDLIRMYYKRQKYNSTQMRQTRWGRRSYETVFPEEIIDDGVDSNNPLADLDDLVTEVQIYEQEGAWLNVGSVIIKDGNGITTTDHYYTDAGLLIYTKSEFVSLKDKSLNTTTVTLNIYYSNGLLHYTATDTKRSATDRSRVATVYGYVTMPNGQKFLSTEQVTSYFYNAEEGEWVLEDTRVTTKNPTGHGQGNVTDNKGNSSTGANKGDDRASPFLIDKYADFYNDDSTSTPFAEYKYRDIEGLTLFDTSFPIQDISSDDLKDADDSKGRGRLIELTEKIKWLNNKTRETVIVDLYEFPHLIDFNDRIILDGVEYFLSSNVLSTAPHVYNKQHLTLVRWF